MFDLQKGFSKFFLMHTNFLTMITISLFYYYKKVFILRKCMDDWEKFDEISLLEK